MRSCHFYLAAVIGFLAAPALNLTVDPTGVLRPPAMSHNPYLNLRHIKMEKVLTHEEPFYGLIMGSSRSGLFQVEWLSDPDDWYNAAVLDARITDLELMTRSLAEADRLPQRLLIGLDIFAFADAGPLPSLALHHPSVSKVPKHSWLLGALFAPNLLTIVTVAVLPRPRTPLIEHVLESSGHYRLPHAEDVLATDPGSYTAHHLPTSSAVKHDLVIDERQLAALDRLVNRAERSGVSVCLFWHPHRREIVESYMPGDVARLKAGIEASGLSVIDLMDDPLGALEDAWFDAKHLRSNGSQAVLSRLSDHPNCLSAD